MGEVSETMTKRKKKGRPSLLDLQKRSLKKQKQQQQQPQNSNLTNSYSNAVHHDDEDDDERREKKLKLLVGLNSHLQNQHSTLFPNSFPSNSIPDSDPEIAHKRRKIDPNHHGSEQTVSISITFSLSLFYYCGDLWGLVLSSSNTRRKTIFSLFCFSFFF